jgi:sirohydrochlorin cobaltochelatase
MGQQEFLQVATMLADATGRAVEPCFLEIAQPNISAALARLAQRPESVLVVPLLLFTAGHAKDDVPEAVAAANQSLGLQILGHTAALEDHPCLLALSELRVRTAMQHPLLPGTELLLVGRGGSDPTAIAAARNYAKQLGQSLGLNAQTAFVAKAEPSLRAALADFADRRIPQVVVVPHLLFEGDVLRAVREQVQSAREQFGHVRWELADHLGPHALLVDALVDRIQAALAT